MMYGYGAGIGGWGYALMAIGMVLFWGAVIFGIVALVRYGRRDGPQRREPAEPPAPGPDRRACLRHPMQDDDVSMKTQAVRAAGNTMMVWTDASGRLDGADTGQAQAWPRCSQPALPPSRLPSG